jgi:sporulation protein YlmC with PRC-barrel domain
LHEKLRRLRLDEMRGAPVYDNTGERIARVEEIVHDRHTGVPAWIRIGTGFFGSKRVLVPVTGAALHDDGIMVPYTKDQMRDSPDVEQEPLSRQYEAELAAYYSLGSSELPSQTHAPDWGPRGRIRNVDQEMTRAEEEIRARTPPVEAAERG